MQCEKREDKNGDFPENVCCVAVVINDADSLASRRGRGMRWFSGGMYRVRMGRGVGRGRAEIGGLFVCGVLFLLYFADTGERAFDSAGAALKHMSIDHGGSDVFVSEQFLNGADIVTGFEEMRGEGMAKRVCMYLFGYAGFAGGFFDRFLKNAFVDVVSLSDAAARVDGAIS